VDGTVIQITIALSLLKAHTGESAPEREMEDLMPYAASIQATPRISATTLTLRLAAILAKPI